MRQHFANPALALTPHILFVRTKILHEWLFHAIGCALAQNQKPAQQDQGLICGYYFWIVQSKNKERDIRQ
ncbi:hypothetical protein DZB77_24415 [Salmonella enterica]|nr:hypothetical protein [Salmonella enterica]